MNHRTVPSFRQKLRAFTKGASQTQVKVTRHGKTKNIATQAKYVVSFSNLPGKNFGPWSFAETVRDLTVSALLDAVAARNLVLDAFMMGSATTGIWTAEE